MDVKWICLVLLIDAKIPVPGLLVTGLSRGITVLWVAYLRWSESAQELGYCMYSTVTYYCTSGR